MSYSQLRELYVVAGIQRTAEESLPEMTIKLVQLISLNIDRQQCNSWTTVDFKLSSLQVRQMGVILEINFSGRPEATLRKIYERLEANIQQN